MATFTTTQATVRFDDTDGAVSFTATRPAVTFTAAYQSVTGGGGGAPEVFRSDLYISADPTITGSIVDGVLDIPDFAGAFTAGTTVMFDFEGLGADRGIWIANDDPGNPGWADGTFTYAPEADQPYRTGNAGLVASFGIDPFTSDYIVGIIRYAGDWDFTDLGYYVPGDETDWIDPEGLTYSSALDELAARPAGAALSDTTPVDLGTAAAGVGTAASRDDHVHDRPTASDVGAVAASLVDGKGELLVGSANDTVDNLAVGTDGHILTLDSAQTLGVKWAAPPSGTVDVVSNVATSTILGRVTGGSGNSEELTAAQARTVIGVQVEDKLPLVTRSSTRYGATFATTAAAGSPLVPYETGTAPTAVAIAAGGLYYWPFSGLSAITAFASLIIDVTATALTGSQTITVGIWSDHTDNGPGASLWSEAITVGTTTGVIQKTGLSRPRPSDGWIGVHNPSGNAGSVTLRMASPSNDRTWLLGSAVGNRPALIKTAGGAAWPSDMSSEPLFNTAGYTFSQAAPLILAGR
jgi:hypothetical protein